MTSTLFLVTAFSFLGFYDGFTDYAGAGKDILVIYSERGSTPFTGIVSIAVLNDVDSIKGVIASSPEVIAACTINGQSLFVRGVIPQELAQLNPLTMVDGCNLNLNDTDSVIVGQTLAQRLDLKIGSTILVFGVLSQKYLELNVKGIFYSATSLNDEAIVPLYVGQWLRGLSYDEVTLIRAKIDPNQISPDQLYKLIANMTQSTTPSPSASQNNNVQQELQNLLPITPSTIGIENVNVEESQQFMTSYLDHYGVSEDALLILAILVLIFASGTTISATTLFIKQHSSDIAVIRSIGTSSRKIKFDIALKLSLCALIATALGTLASEAFLVVFQKVGFLEVLSHTLTFQLDPSIIVANLALLSLIICLNIGRMELKP